MTASRLLSERSTLNSPAGQPQDVPPLVLSIVIVTWNSEDFIGGCLDSVALAIAGMPAEVLVVDNSSSDGTARIVRERYPWVALVVSPTNLGFARANNQAFSVTRGVHVLLLNPDTIINRAALEECLRALETAEPVGMVGCRVVGADGSVQMECAQELPALRDVLIETLYLHMLFPTNRVLGRRRMSYWDHMTNRVVPSIGGAFMMVRKQVIEEVGGLDETFFMYYEDMEFCARVAKAGWCIQYLGNPSIVHFGGKSRAQSGISFDYQTPLSRHLYFKTYRGTGAAVAYRALSAGQSIIWLTGALLLSPFKWLLPKRRPRLALHLDVHWRRLCWSLGFDDLDSIVRPSPEAANRRRLE